MEPSSSHGKDLGTLRVGEVRARILAEHAKLRVVIAEVERYAQALSAGQHDLVDKLREAADNLYRSLARHIDQEEAVIAPILRQIDAWGPVRCEQLLRDHAAQREALAAALRDLATGGGRLGQTVQAMCSEILHDMRREEHDLLHPDLWREDLTSIEIGG